MRPSFKNYLLSRQKIIDKAIGKYLPKKSEVNETLYSAMQYSIFSGGKRLRPILALEGAALFGDEKKILPAACAIEMIHTYSLIHDDLPCMDNDEMRRGKPTVWKKYGEGVALLCGNAMLVLAYQILVQEQAKYIKNSKESIIKLLQEMSLMIGASGLIGGQMQDIFSSNDLDDLKYIHLNKTAKLIILSVKVGAVLFGAKDKYLNVLHRFGEKIGTAYQIADDILDRGKRKERSNYADLVGLDVAKKCLREEIHQARICLDIFKEKGKNLKDIAEMIGERVGDVA